MKRTVMYLSALASMVIFTGTCFGQIKFTLGFGLGQPNVCGGTISGPPGAKVQFDVFATLTQEAFEANKGASGFSIGFRAENADLVPNTAASGASCGTGELVVPIADFFCSATTIDPAKVPDSGPLAGNPQGSGYVDGLAFTIGKSLQGNATFTIGKVRAEVTIPASGESTARFLFIDGLQGPGQPVKNGITSAGKTVDAASGQLTLGSCEVKLAVQAPKVDLIVESGGAGEGGGGATDIPVAIGEKGQGTVFIKIRSDIAGAEGVAGWQLSLSYSNKVNVLGISPASELFAAVPALGGVLGFNETYNSEGTAPLRVDPAAIYTKVDPILEADCDLTDGAPQGKGIVSGVVLAIPPVAGSTLPSSSEVRVLKIDFELATPFTGLGDAPAGPNLQWVDCHFGPGIKIKNRVTVQGGSVAPDEAIGLPEGEFRFVPVQAKANFIRGDANNDRKVNIADPIFTINALFRGGPAVACADAADANDDESISLADAVFTINYQFTGGPAPSAPFPNCGSDDDSSDATCPPGSTSCS